MNTAKTEAEQNEAEARTRVYAARERLLDARDYLAYDDPRRVKVSEAINAATDALESLGYNV